MEYNVDRSLFLEAEKDLLNSYEEICNSESFVKKLLESSTGTNYSSIVSDIYSSFLVMKYSISQLIEMERKVKNKLQFTDLDFGFDLSNFSIDIDSTAIVKFFSQIKDLFILKNENSLDDFFNYSVDELKKDLLEVYAKTSATICTAGLSLLEGTLNIAEGLRDAAEILCGVPVSVVTGLIDCGQFIHGAITGKSWESATAKVWDNIMNEVKVETVKNSFDYIYDKTLFGEILKEGTYNYNTTRAVTSKVGTVAGTVLLSLATGGAFSAIAPEVTLSTSVSGGVSAAAVGIGQGAEKSWNNGANALEGIIYAGGNGLWQGLKYYTGFLISNAHFFSGTTVETISSTYFKNKLLDNFSRVVLSGVDASLDGFVVPFLDSMYKDGYIDNEGNYQYFSNNTNFIDKYKTLFNENGGMNYVLSQAAIGSCLSLLANSVDIVGNYHGYNFTKNYFDNGAYKKDVVNMWKGYLSEDEINDVLKRTTIDILPKDEFIKFDDERGVLGVNFGGDNIYVLSSSSLKYGSKNSLRQTFLHEFTHSVNFDGVTSGYDNSFGKAFNEVLTEHFAAKYLGSNPNGYANLVNKFRYIQKMIPDLSDDVLKQSYLKSNTFPIENVLYKYTGNPDFYYDFVSAFDSALAGDYEYLDNLVKYLIKGDF